jgi:Outer membrane protein beta-barrel domain
LKKHITTQLAFMILVCFSANVSAAKLSAGIKGGLSLGTLTGKYMETLDTNSEINHSMKAAFNGYGLISVDFIDYLGVQLEMGYADKGKKYSDAADKKNYFKMNFKYIEVPFLIKGMYPMGVAKPMIYAGPSFGFLLSSTLSLHNENPNRDTTIVIPDSSRNGFDIGIAFGGGSTFNVGPGSIIADIRYTIGVRTILNLTENDKRNGRKESDAIAKNGALAFLLGYQLDF